LLSGLSQADGRYILEPGIFELLSAGERGASGEIQITDAMIRLAQKRPFYAFKIRRHQLRLRLVVGQFEF
jgi:UTP-glucose-1-phosphate uridylyltransferase